MNLDTYIAELEKLRQEVGGEVRVVTSAGSHSPIHAIGDADFPTIETLQVKTPRESYEKIYRGEGYSFTKVPAVDSGVKVVVI